MKLFHLSDLHLGKRLNGFSLMEDQAAILEQILHYVDIEHPDAILIAGDIYDKPIPPAEAISIFDSFLVQMSERGIQIFLISGNHDSPERLAFGSTLMHPSGIHISPVYDGSLVPITLSDAYGTIDFYLLPFLKPVQVRHFYPEETIESYTDAVRCALSHRQKGTAKRSVLLSHQFVTGAIQCESEELLVGGVEQIDVQVFHEFDYVALGHLHGPQAVGRPTVRYCGTPLKYSFSEANHQKSISVVTLHVPGQIDIQLLPLTPHRDLLERTADFETLLSDSFYQTFDQTAYLHLTLTDENEIPDAISKLRTIYPNIMKLDYCNTRTAKQQALSCPAQAERYTPMELFAEFYQTQNNQPLTAMQTEFLENLLGKIWEDDQ